MHHLIRMLCVFLLVGSVSASELAPPTGEIVLVISGNVTVTNSDQGAQFDLAMLEELGASTIVTDSPWTSGPTTFTGVPLNVLLEAVGARSTSFRATALDNYWYDIAGIDFDQYPIILAYKRDGEYMSERNLGPLWIMYPFDEFPELNTEINKASCVWHLYSMVIE